MLEDNRTEVEREFICLLLNKNEAINKIQVLPKYLYNPETKRLLEYIIECYKENKVVLPVKISEKHKDFDISLYVDIFTDTFFDNVNWEKNLLVYENTIVKNYKEDILNNLTIKYSKKEIDYDAYIKKIKELDEIKLHNIKNKNMLTIDDIDMATEESYEYIKSNTTMIDNAIKGFALGQLSVWSGGNASAKSTYLNQIAIETIHQGYNVAIYSGELIAKRLLKWITMQCAGKQNMSYNEEKQYWFVNSYAKEKILKWLNNKLFIYDNNCGNKVKEIIGSIKSCVIKNNVKVIILDNLMSMNLATYGENKYDIQSAFIQDLSALAKELNVHIHFVCHPRKSTSFLRKNDISGSADLTNIADNVFILHRVNNDFRIKTKETFKWNDNYELYNYTNVIEICKNRELGVEDYFVGLFFEKESKRLLNSKDERRHYKWESSQ